MNARADKVLDLARKLAVEVGWEREKFRLLYDAIIVELANNARLFPVAVLDDNLDSPANDVIAFTMAFRRAIDGNWAELLVRRGVDQGALGPNALALMKPAQRKPRRGGQARRPRKRNPGIELQAVMDVARGFDDPTAHFSGMMRTIPKVCQIRLKTNGLQSAGTGFLIGEQSVLTSWHVIQPLLDPATGEELPNSDQALEVVFDYLDSPGNGSAKPTTYKVVKEWLGDHSTCAASEKPTTDGITSNTLQAGMVDLNHLDFAVIRIKGSPGRERGYVELSKDFLVLPTNGALKLTVFQHPNKFPQKFSMGDVSGFFGVGQPPPRLRHRANTLSGSSGGLCVNSEFKSIALHQAAVLDNEGKVIANQAVPAAHIAPKLLRAFDVDRELDPLWNLRDKDESPVIGREGLQESVWRATRGEKRVIVVRGTRGMGLSFSVKILGALRPVNDAVIVSVTANAVGTDAVAFATQLLEKAGGKLKPGEALSRPSAAATTDSAWVKDQLAPALIKRLKAAVNGRTLWLVIDDLDEFDVPAGDARDLLMSLVAATEDAKFLRFLLLGDHGGFVPRQQEMLDLVDDDTLSWPTTTDIETYIRRLCVAKKRAHSPDVMSVQAEAVVLELRATAENLKQQYRVAVNYIVSRVWPLLIKGK